MIFLVVIAWSSRAPFFSELFKTVVSKGSENDIKLSQIIIARTQRYRSIIN